MLQGLGMVDQEKYNLSKLCETRLSDLAGNMLGAELCTSRGVSKCRVVEPCGNIVFVSQWGVLFGGAGPEPYPAHLLPPKTLGNPCGILKVPCHVACSALIIVNATEVWHHCDAVCAFVSVVTLEALAVGALKVDAAYF